MRWFTFVALTLTACCTEVGLLAGISFELSPEAADALTQGPSNIRTCFNGTCWDSALDLSDAGVTREVSFNADTRTLSQWQRVTRVRKPMSG